MGSGLSMTSVNKIKQLAEAHEYDLAEPILDSQDLEKSFNPQFLRVCGEVYENVGRLQEARQMYVKAHSMAPEANRIIFSLINFYLKMGYYKLADRYFEEYVFYSSGDEQDLLNIRYVMKKGKGALPEELYDILYPYYADNMDPDWSFELILLSKILGKDGLEVLVTDYKATYKNGRYVSLVDDVINNIELAVKMFYIYSEGEREDSNPEEEELRGFEEKQLKEDYFKMNPEEAEEKAVITALVTDEPKDKLSTDNIEKGIKDFIKRKFKKKSDESADTDDSNNENADSAENTEGDGSVEPAPNSGEGTGDEVLSSESQSDIAEAVYEENVVVGEPNSESVEEVELEADFSSEADVSFEQEFVTYEFDDGFAPESDTIAGLSENDYDFEETSSGTNVFKDFAKFQQSVASEKTEDVTEEETFEPELSYEIHTSFESDTVSEESDELEESFDSGYSTSYESDYEAEAEPTFEEEPEPEPEETFEPEPEPDFDTDTDTSYTVATETDTSYSYEPDTDTSYTVATETDTSYSYEPETDTGYTATTETDTSYSYETDTDTSYTATTETDTSYSYEPDTDTSYTATTESDASYSYEPDTDTSYTSTTESDTSYSYDAEERLSDEFVPNVDTGFDTGLDDDVESDSFVPNVEEYSSDSDDSYSFDTNVVYEEGADGEESIYESEVDTSYETKTDSVDSYYTNVDSGYSYDVDTESDNKLDIESDPDPSYDVETESSYSYESESTYSSNSTYSVEETVESTETSYESSYESESQRSYDSYTNSEPTAESYVESTVEREPEQSSSMVPAIIHEPSYMKDDLPTMDFRRFSSDYFPGMSNEEIEVHNRFDDVMKTESEKLDEGLKEEEEKLREAEALLASLGIKL